MAKRVADASATVVWRKSWLVRLFETHICPLWSQITTHSLIQLVCLSSAASQFTLYHTIQFQPEDIHREPLPKFNGIFSMNWRLFWLLCSDVRRNPHELPHPTLTKFSLLYSQKAKTHATHIYSLYLLQSRENWVHGNSFSETSCLLHSTRLWPLGIAKVYDKLF